MVLLARVPDRDESFEAVFDDLFGRARRVAYRILGDRGSAEDVAAEALARAYARWSTVRDLPYRDAWVLRVATNLAIDITRKRRVELVPVPPGDIGDATAIRMALVAALRALPRRQREAIALRYLGGLSEREVADALHVSPGTVKTHLHRGIAALRAQLGADTEELDLAD